MKLHLHDASGQNAITGHGSGYVQINHIRFASPLIVTAETLISPWAAPSFEVLSFADFSALLTLKPALVVFGSGVRFRFPATPILAAFSQARIGFEVMDTAAACRTYNVLMSEGRNVAAALYV
ncbi:MAG: Mth938-like domain-containing protein [Rhodocyclaceae bacterium]|nr:Mth938-like domain-containing protein [Rhodocyclaceae bacterium]